MSVPLSMLTKRNDFLRVQASPNKVVTKGLIVCISPSPSSSQTRIGFTVTKTVGNAVVRNRIRRRLRALVKDVLPKFVEQPADYVFIGRKATLDRDFLALTKDLKYALHTVKKDASKAA